MRRVALWRPLIATEVALLGVVASAALAGVAAIAVSAMGAALLTLLSWGWASGRDWRRAIRTASPLAYSFSGIALAAALWAISESLSRRGWMESTVLCVVLLALTQLPKSAWDRTTASAPRRAPHASPEHRVIWLRSFHDDTTRIRSRFCANEWVSFVGIRSRFETLISICAARAGADLVAIGRPGERLRPVGAVRSYLPHDDWQRSIEHMIRESHAVFVVVGLSDGLAWEADTLIRLGAVDRTLFILPPLYFSKVEKRIESFLVHLGVPEREVREVDWELPSVLGFYVASSGHLGVVMGDGRDDINYGLMIETFLHSLSGKPLPSQPSMSSYANFQNERLGTVHASKLAWERFSPECRDIVESALESAGERGHSVALIDLWHAALEDQSVVGLLDDWCPGAVATESLQPTGPNSIDWYSRFSSAAPQWRYVLTEPRLCEEAHSVLLEAADLAGGPAIQPDHLLRALLVRMPGRNTISTGSSRFPGA